jgi:hypothetical protein
MKSLIDQAAIRRKATIAHVASVGGLLILLVGVLFPYWLPKLANLTIVFILAGFALAAVGVFLANRWVKKPRPEDVLDRTLKSLSDQFRLYHYQTPWDHLLLTPNGLIILDVINLEGIFTYEDQHWKQKMTMGRAFRYFFEERLGDPVKRVQQGIQDLTNRIRQELPGCGPIPVTGLIVFIHPLSEVTAKETPVAVCNPKNLQKRIPVQGNRLSPDAYHSLQEYLDGYAKKRT